MATVPNVIASLNATLFFEYGIEIDPNIVSQVPFDSPLYDYLEAGPGAPHRDVGKAAVFALLTAADFTASNDGSFACGGCPPNLDVDREIKSVTKKCYGALAGVKDVDIIASSMSITPHGIAGLDDASMRYRDDAEFLVNLLYVRTRQAIDYASIRGNIAANVNNFNGLEAAVNAVAGSQVLAVNGAFTKAHLDELVIQMLIAGITPTAIACNPIMLSTLVDSYTGSGSNVSINMNMGEGAQTLGYWANEIMTPAGRLPIIADRRFTVTGTAPTFTSDIFVLTRDHAGEQILKLEWQVMPSVIDLGRWNDYCTTKLFVVWSNVALVDKSDWFAQGRLTGIISTYRPTPATVNPGD